MAPSVLNDLNMDRNKVGIENSPVIFVLPKATQSLFVNMTRGPLTIAVTGAIGLTTEAVAAVKASQSKKNGSNEDRNGFANEIYTDRDEAQGLSNPGQRLILSKDSLITMPISNGNLRPLELPVIIPQRRPRQRSRGFLRAYAPLLEGNQIDQAMFLGFLNGFDEEIKVIHAGEVEIIIRLMSFQKQGLFIVANLAVGASVMTATALVGHNPFVDLAAFAVHSTIETGRRMYITDKYGSGFQGLPADIDIAN